jgi:hypothetical protein
MAGFKTQRGEIFVERRPLKELAPEQKFSKGDEVNTGAKMAEDGRRKGKNRRGDGEKRRS